MTHQEAKRVKTGSGPFHDAPQPTPVDSSKPNSSNGQLGVDVNTAVVSSKLNGVLIEMLKSRVDDHLSSGEPISLAEIKKSCQSILIFNEDENTEDMYSFVEDLVYKYKINQYINEGDLRTLSAAGIRKRLEEFLDVDFESSRSLEKIEDLIRHHYWARVKREIPANMDALELYTEAIQEIVKAVGLDVAANDPKNVLSKLGARFRIPMRLLAKIPPPASDGKEIPFSSTNNAYLAKKDELSNYLNKLSEPLKQIYLKHPDCVPGNNGSKIEFRPQAALEELPKNYYLVKRGCLLDNTSRSQQSQRQSSSSEENVGSIEIDLASNDEDSVSEAKEEEPVRRKDSIASRARKTPRSASKPREEWYQPFAPVSPREPKGQTSKSKPSPAPRVSPKPSRVSKSASPGPEAAKKKAASPAPRLPKVLAAKGAKVKKPEPAKPRGKQSNGLKSKSKSGSSSMSTSTIKDTIHQPLTAYHTYDIVWVEVVMQLANAPEHLRIQREGLSTIDIRLSNLVGKPILWPCVIRDVRTDPPYQKVVTGPITMRSTGKRTDFFAPNIAEVNAHGYPPVYKVMLLSEDQLEYWIPESRLLPFTSRKVEYLPGLSDVALASVRQLDIDDLLLDYVRALATLERLVKETFNLCGKFVMEEASLGHLKVQSQTFPAVQLGGEVIRIGDVVRVHLRALPVNFDIPPSASEVAHSSPQEFLLKILFIRNNNDKGTDEVEIEGAICHLEDAEDLVADVDKLDDLSPAELRQALETVTSTRQKRIIYDCKRLLCPVLTPTPNGGPREPFRILKVSAADVLGKFYGHSPHPATDCRMGRTLKQGTELGRTYTDPLTISQELGKDAEIVLEPETVAEL
ncbi:hypothetical protein HDU96_007077 [Phlyctochytrium bullatum]|nr:hypothetical protein HDU96_007077 [Phlyctochytrium bullatum]